MHVNTILFSESCKNIWGILFEGDLSINDSVLFCISSLSRFSKEAELSGVNGNEITFDCVDVGVIKSFEVIKIFIGRFLGKFIDTIKDSKKKLSG